MKSLIICSALLLLSAQCYAGTFSQTSCGRSFVSKGDSQGRVLQLCGNPASVDSHDKQFQSGGPVVGGQVIGGQVVGGYYAGGSTSTIHYEDWTYFEGRDTKILHFQNGRLKSIEVQ